MRGAWMDRLDCFIAASTTDLLGPARMKKIMQKWTNIEEFFDLPVSEQMLTLKLSGLKAESALSSMIKKGQKARAICESKHIKMITIEDDAYPPILKLIPDPPPMLYLWGEFNYSIPKLGVVGTRRVSPEGENINTYFCREISSYQIGIVSGLAQGHDAIAARVTLDNEGYTVAVLGTGIDVVYPTANSRLFEEIKAKGCLLSEYPPGTPGNAWRFPLRNRIISGLSQAVLVIQAPARSGALITAQYAEAQGKNIFAIPGNPVDDRNAGTNLLIQNGARVALKPEDIVQDIFQKVPRRVQGSDWKNLPGLEKEEQLILAELGSEMYIDDLLQKTSFQIASLNTLLMKLELKGLVKQFPGRYYIRNV